MCDVLAYEKLSLNGSLVGHESCVMWGARCLNADNLKATWWRSVQALHGR